MHSAYEKDATVETLINAWHDAVNNRDLAAAAATVTDPVEVSGPRGTHTITAEEFADWIIRSGIRLRPLSAHPVDDVTMVIEQEATWPDNADAPTPVATLFKTRDGGLAVIRRFDSLHDALRAAGAP
ncbi:hypothetical protein [Paractinoplanes atraurantiacus]|uniref:SnoaL-like domain-containing protein n=1 Tax=Paractinoplanes atraurantiacus TaxID=1036182 RepID=A0A285HBN3_9ACTN|nr:hypothetical protein [Actinoplanes atraurantiacus]SNY33148.1 hypothetical protein SAMN05421748_10487 [Actinoplanes atraurantiacus]